MPNKTLNELATEAKQNGIKTLFNNPERVDKFTFGLAGLYIDLSKTHLSDELIQNYQTLAEQLGLEAKKRAMFAGEKINFTENREVLHTLLRDLQAEYVENLEQKFQQQAQQSQDQFLSQVANIRSELFDQQNAIKDIVHIGIGGSSLGPQLLKEALVGHGAEINVHFVSNIDAHEILSVLSACQPESTLIVGVSKTFTTAETLMNIRTAKSWMEQSEDALFWDHFYAVTASAENAQKFGAKDHNIITFPEWVGGRYSIWSAVSLSVALVLGGDQFQEFLAGAAEIDKDFYLQPAEKNLPFLLAAMDHFYANYMAAASKATFAYDYRLRSLVPYLQQLETESNGKDRDLNGEPVEQQTSMAVWGGTGTDMQHSTFQLLHQGTQLIPVEFVIVKNPDHARKEHHQSLLANAVAQSAALLSGRSLEQVNEIPGNAEQPESIRKSKVFTGDKPSTTLILESLTPRSLGALLALYEQRTFCGGVLAEINSFDQMGVELGKVLANEIEPILSKVEKTNQDKFDASTNALIQHLLS